ncbi:hypothetical protein BDZ91DRAFT_730533 [Kalaharituber pfeilii]|nr:hypothetical protein BDZ91DRAFT_730533 [Kalaharituber pfeilii]
MSGPPRIPGTLDSRSKSKAKATTDNGNDYDMTTLTATTTLSRQKLQGDSHGLRNDAFSGSIGRTGQLPRNGSSHPRKPNPWGVTTSSTSDNNRWTSSWSTLQNLASTVLGTGNDSDEEGEEAERQRRIRIAEKRRRAGIDGTVGGKSPNSSASHIATSSSSVRSRVSTNSVGDGEGGLRTRGRRKQEESSFKPQLSTALPSSTASTIENRRLHKRNTSPEVIQTRATSSPPSTDRGDSDTLAYIYKVKPTDTLEGVVIMFNIHPSALRRANRLWMGDSIQARKELFLPVDECLVKGRPLTEEEEKEEEEAKKERNANTTPSSQGQLGGGEGGISSPDTSHKKGPPQSRDLVDSLLEDDDNLAHLSSSLNFGGNHTRKSDPSYQPLSIVFIEGIGKIRIARLSRNKLSHFPPRRRQRGVSLSSTTVPERDFLPSDEPPSSVFSTKRVSEAYTGVSGPVMGAGEELPTLGQMFNQVAKETFYGVENVGHIVEGFVRKMVVKVGELARDGGEAAIELAEHVGGSGDRGRSDQGHRSFRESSDCRTESRSSTQERCGSTRTRGRGTSSGSSVGSSRIVSRAGSITSLRSNAQDACSRTSDR